MKLKIRKTHSSKLIIKDSFGGKFPSNFVWDDDNDFKVKLIQEGVLGSIYKIGSFILKLPSLFIQFEKIAFKDKKRTGFIFLLYKLLAFLMFPFFIFSSFKVLISPNRFETAAFINLVAPKVIFISKGSFDVEYPEFIDTLSHEVIHLLQMKHGDFDINVRAEDIKRVNIFCNNYGRAKRENLKLFSRYVFSKVEIEAHLHNLISNFYKKTGVFPTSKRGFLTMLMSIHEVWDVISTNISNPVFLEPNIREYTLGYSFYELGLNERVLLENDSTSIFIYMLNDIKDIDCLLKLFDKTLPAHYMNLLQLYGCEIQS